MKTKVIAALWLFVLGSGGTAGLMWFHKAHPPQFAMLCMAMGSMALIIIVLGVTLWAWEKLFE